MASRSGVPIKTSNVRIKSMKLFFKRGVNPTSGSLTAGTKIRIVHSPRGGIRKYG